MVIIASDAKLVKSQKGEDMNNLIVRMELMKASMKMYQLAEVLGISENTLLRKMRHELSDEEQKEIVTKIQEWSKHHER